MSLGFRGIRSLVTRRLPESALLARRPVDARLREKIYRLHGFTLVKTPKRLGLAFPYSVAPSLLFIAVAAADETCPVRTAALAPRYSWTPPLRSTRRFLFL